MKKLNNRGYALVIILILLLVAAAIAFVFFKDKLGLGGADGDGSGSEKVQTDFSEENTTEQTTTEQDGNAGKTIVIIVKQSKYIIDEKEYTLSEIEGILKEDTEKQIKYVMEDNYAGTEAWDQLKSLFASYDITPIKED